MARAYGSFTVMLTHPTAPSCACRISWSAQYSRLGKPDGITRLPHQRRTGYRRGPEGFRTTYGDISTVEK